MQTGEIIGSGRDADVYAIDDSWVLRRTRDNRSQAREAGVMAHLYAHGYPVPEIRAAEEPEDLIMRRVAGPTLVQAALAGDLDVDQVAAILAELLVRLHAVPARDGDSYAGSANGDHTTAETAILHLDLHPLNVLLTADGPVVIDWTNTREDHPALDWGMSALILAQVALEGTELSQLAEELLCALLARRPTQIVLTADVMARVRAHRAAVPDETVTRHLDEAVALVIARTG